jgi:PREDICTED: similar to meiotic recombination protein SPO11 isoform 1
MAHNALNTVTPQIRWLGLHPKDILRWKIPEYAQRALSKRDQGKIAELETRPYIRSNVIWADQVQTLKKSGLKAEMQVLLELDDNFLVTTYIPMKIQEGDWL